MIIGTHGHIGSPEIDASAQISKLFAELADELAQPFDHAMPIGIAPRVCQAPVMLFCPKQGGWHVGEWRETGHPGRWVAAIDVLIGLNPTYWAHVPPSPDEVCADGLAGMSRSPESQSAPIGVPVASFPSNVVGRELPATPEAI